MSDPHAIAAAEPIADSRGPVTIATPRPHRPSSRKVVTTAADSKYRSGTAPFPASVRGSHENCIVIPSSPASVNSTAKADQRYAASVPSDTRVSITSGYALMR